MEHYLQRLTQDMELRGFSQNTKEYYPRDIAKFLEYCKKPPEEVDEKEICDFLHHLLTVEKLKPGTVNTFNAAIRFFYEVTLNRRLNLKAVPRFKPGYKMPEILTGEELKRLFDSCTNIKHKAILMTLYGSGIRLRELTGLKICDIDSKNMQIFIREGKRKKDRYALLSQANLNILREYWKAYHPKEWLFEGRTPGKPYSPRSVEVLFHHWLNTAGIEKNATVHTMRHCFATHLLENKNDIFHIKQLMGHSNIKSTAVYLHVAKLNILSVTSPLDLLLGGKIDD